VSGRDSSEVATASEDDEEEESDDEEPITTFRFEHSENTDGHHVVVGREGVLRRCEDEPITTPGAVQGFGVLIVLEEEYETGDLVVRQVSEVSCTDVYETSKLMIERYRATWTLAQISIPLIVLYQDPDK
jgi:hypothetical protein